MATTSKSAELDGPKSQVDLFFLKPSAKTSAPYANEDILVIGELKQVYKQDNLRAELLQLSRYVRTVFAKQPLRRFVHAFLLCGSVMQTWIYDRSGVYSPGPFNIHDEPDKFVRAIICYASMDATAMGLENFLTEEHQTRSASSMLRPERRVTLQAAENTKILHTYTLGENVSRTNAIVSRATTCFRTLDGHIAKFAWVSTMRTSEVDLLQQARKNSVKGVAMVLAHSTLTSIADIRSGLVFPSAHRFQQPAELSQKRKRKSSTSASTSSGPTQPQWDNRNLVCLVVSPAGRVLSEFQTKRELLEALLDAIIAHKSLLEAGGILHRDISPANIIIMEARTSGGHRGMLIDLDAAKKVDESLSGARDLTGTLPFIAIAVLTPGSRHTYRHDLESFLYVLIWMCAKQAWVNGMGGDEAEPPKSQLERWRVGTLADVARAKFGDMGLIPLFANILDEFPSSLDEIKPLCRRFRTLLFGGSYNPWEESPSGSPEWLYKSIIEAFEDTVHSLK